MKRQASYQIFLFIIAGALSAVAEVLSFKFFTQLFLHGSFHTLESDFWGIHYPLSNILSSIIGIITNYYFSIAFVFERGKHGKNTEFGLFIGISVFTMLLSLGLFQLFYSYIILTHISFLGFTLSRAVITKIIAIGITSVASFILKKKIIFKN